MPSILILGRNGQVARALQSLRWPAGFDVVALGAKELDDPADPGSAAKAAVLDRKPVLVLNAAAFTAVDEAEAEEPLARAINADQPRAVAQACGIRNIPLVHLSTDYVFDGTKTSAYIETDTPNPINAYGRTKLAGDENIRREATAPWAILRTSWVFSEAADSFPARILGRAVAGEALRVVDDQVGCPTPALSLAEAVQAIGLRLLEGDLAAQGLFNFCGAQAMSWYGFAGKLIDAAVKAGMQCPELQPIKSDQFPTTATRPRNSVLDCAKITRECGIAPAGIEPEIERVVGAILAR